MVRDYTKTRPWRKLRSECLARDNYICRRCGRHESQLPPNVKLTAAHIQPRRLGGPDTLANLVTLCSQCHGTVDGGRRYR